MTKPIKNILVICGPTASGKTSLALEVASRLPQANILSADSRQTYKGLDVITGKDIPADLPLQIKLFGLDIARPDKIFNLSDFVNYSQKIIQESSDRNIPLIIVGGTGLYLQAITSKLLSVHVPPDSVLRLDLEKLTLGELKKCLEKINPKKYSSLNNSDLNNPRRLIRAIEISTFQQRNKSLYSESDRESIQKTFPNFHWVGLKVDKKVLENKIHQRVINRIENGALEEVKDLINNYPNHLLPIYSSLGVKQIREYLDKKLSKEELIIQWTKAEIEYVRRQMVWFQKQPDIVWYDKDRINEGLIKSLSTLIK